MVFTLSQNGYGALLTFKGVVPPFFGLGAPAAAAPATGSTAEPLPRQSILGQWIWPRVLLSKDNYHLFLSL